MLRIFRKISRKHRVYESSPLRWIFTLDCQNTPSSSLPMRYLGTRNTVLLAVVTLSVGTITNPTTYATPNTGYIQTKLVSDVPGLAPNTNRKLINPWGFSENPDGQFRVAANGTGRAILLDAQGEREAADIIIPPPPGSPSKTIS